MTEKMLLHASCVSIEGQGVLIAGLSGFGKSDLALRLIDEGARLVSDDQTELIAEGGWLLASPPATIEGLIEVRGVGILRMDFVRDVPIALHVELAKDPTKIERMPDLVPFAHLGIPVPLVFLSGIAASAPAVIRTLLRPDVSIISDK